MVEISTKVAKILFLKYGNLCYKQIWQVVAKSATEEHLTVYISSQLCFS